MKDIKSGVKYNERWRTSDNVEKDFCKRVEVTFLLLKVKPLQL